MDSILTLIKKLLGIEENIVNFDIDIISYINSVFPVLNQLGIGPEDGFLITDKTAKWSEYIGDVKNLSNVQTFIFLKVKLLFDPPASAFVLESMERQIKELEWRINIQVDKPPTIVEEGDDEYGR